MAPRFNRTTTRLAPCLDDEETSSPAGRRPHGVLAHVRPNGAGPHALAHQPDASAAERMLSDLMFAASRWRRATTVRRARRPAALRSDATALGPQPSTAMRGLEAVVAPLCAENVTPAAIRRCFDPEKHRSNFDSSTPLSPPSRLSVKLPTGRSGTPVTVDLIRRPPRIWVAMRILIGTRPFRSATSPGSRPPAAGPGRPARSAAWRGTATLRWRCRPSRRPGTRRPPVAR